MEQSSSNPMKEQETDQDLQEQPLSTQSQPQRERLTWWRAPLAGYVLCPFFTLLALFVQLVFQRLGLGLYTATTGFYLSTVVVAWLWGMGPALLSALLAYIVLESLVVPPYGIFTFNGWSDITFFLPFFLTQLLIIVITMQREQARRKAQRQAQELAQGNQALAHSNQELERANRLKDLFLSRASHELKNPLAAIRGEAQLLSRRLARSPQTASDLPSLRPSLEKINTQTVRLDTLIDDFLTLGSLRSGKVPIRLAPCDLGSICREVVEDQQVLTGCRIKLELPPSPVMLQADGQRLNQVLRNLISNAIKYSLENTCIRVSVLQKPSHVLLTVYNDGPVIPQERQTLIFEPYYRAPEAKYSSVGGWGLGLSICKEIVEGHGGEIWVESSEGKGTTFFIQLPG